MANLLDKYGDATDEMTVPASESIGKAKQRAWLKKKELRAIKALTKALRQRNKLVKQELELRKAETAVADEKPAETDAKGTDKRKRDNGAKGFLDKLGDAICKAIPKLLTTLATLAFGFFFKTKFAGKVL